MFDVILYEPKIPPNTGNIMRLCANTGARLHLIEPMGFRLDDRLLRRAGLDYREWVSVRVHAALADYLTAATPRRLYACSTRGTVVYTQPAFQPGDGFLFGCETGGLPQAALDGVPVRQRLFIPMQPDNRCLNLSNAVAVVVYEAWRQNRFAGGQHVWPAFASPRDVSQ